MVAREKRLIESVEDAKDYVAECVNVRRSISWQYNALNINAVNYHDAVSQIARRYREIWVEENKCRAIFKMDHAGFLPEWVMKYTDTPVGDRENRYFGRV